MWWRRCRRTGGGAGGGAGCGVDAVGAGGTGGAGGDLVVREHKVVVLGVVGGHLLLITVVSSLRQQPVTKHFLFFF